MNFSKGGLVSGLLLNLFLGTLVLAGVVLDGFVFPDSKDEKPDSIMTNGLGDSWSTHYGHLGEDYLNPAGTSVYSIAKGTVVNIFDWPLCTFEDKQMYIQGDLTKEEYTQKKNATHGWGKVVIIKHEIPSETNIFFSTPDKKNIKVIYSQYGHLGKILVHEGQDILKGERIGYVGDMQCLWKDHLHVEIKNSQSYSTDLLTSAGAGFGYSGTDNYAPDRYALAEFINLNKELYIQDNSDLQEQGTVSYSTPSIFFQQIQSFFSNTFSSTQASAFTQHSEEEKDSTEISDTAYKSGVEFLPSLVSISVRRDQSESTVTVTAKNTGDSTWYKTNTSLNVVGGSEKNSMFYHASWITHLRPAQMKEATVSPGQTGSFVFYIRVPEDLDNTLRFQLVEQSGNRFTQIGDAFGTVSFTREEAPQKNIIPIPEIPEQNQTTFFEKIYRIRDVLGEKITDVFDDVSSIIPYIFHGGGSSRRANSEEDDIDAQEETLLPEIAISAETDMLSIVDSSIIVLDGSINEAVFLMTVNGTSTESLQIDREELSWLYPVQLQPFVTTTFQFVGWSEDGNLSSQSVEAMYLYIPPAPQAPSITLGADIASLVVSTSTSVGLYGSFNTTTSYITVNNASSTVVRMNTTTQEWVISVEDAVPFVTTTYTFVGWSVDSMTSSSPVSVDIVYTPDITPQASAPQIVFPLMTTSTTFATSSIYIDITGSAPEDIESVVLSVSGSAMTTLPVIDGSWQTRYQFYGLGSYSIDIYGIETSGQQTDVISYPVSIIRDTSLGYIGFSEIAWMGTEASATDEWFEIMSIEGGEGESIWSYADTIDWSEPHAIEDANARVLLTVEWGTVDELGEYNVSLPISSEYLYPFYTDCVVEFTGPLGFIISEPEQWVFERTDQDTLSNLCGAVYTGALNNSGEHLFLTTPEGAILDEVDASDGWFAGDNDTKEAMIRIDPYASGSDPNNWCSYGSCPESEFIGEPIAEDADGNLVEGSPFSPHQVIYAQL